MENFLLEESSESNDLDIVDIVSKNFIYFSIDLLLNYTFSFLFLTNYFFRKIFYNIYNIFLYLFTIIFNKFSENFRKFREEIENIDRGDRKKRSVLLNENKCSNGNNA